MHLWFVYWLACSLICSWIKNINKLLSPNLINLFIRHKIAFQIPLANCCHTWMPLEFVITHNMLQKKPQEHTHQVPTWSTWAGWQQWNWHHNGPRARPEMWLGLDCCWHMSPFIKHRITLGLQLYGPSHGAIWPSGMWPAQSWKLSWRKHQATSKWANLNTWKLKRSNVSANDGDVFAKGFDRQVTIFDIGTSGKRSNSPREFSSKVWRANSKPSRSSISIQLN